MISCRSSGSLQRRSDFIRPARAEHVTPPARHSVSHTITPEVTRPTQAKPKGHGLGTPTCARSVPRSVQLLCRVVTAISHRQRRSVSPQHARSATCCHRTAPVALHAVPPSNLISLDRPQLHPRRPTAARRPSQRGAARLPSPSRRPPCTWPTRPTAPSTQVAAGDRGAAAASMKRAAVIHDSGDDDDYKFVATNIFESHGLPPEDRLYW